MHRIITYISAVILLSSCMVSSKKYSDALTRESANTILIDNLSSEISNLKQENNALKNSNLMLAGDTIRLEREMRKLKSDYLYAIERGATSNISLQRKSDEYKNSFRRQGVLIQDLQDAILARNSKINSLESSIGLSVNRYLDRDCAILYQTKSGLNLELNDCIILNDSLVADSLNLFISNISDLLLNDDQVSIIIESYSALNDTLLVDTLSVDSVSTNTVSNIEDIWSTNLKKGGFYAAKLIENGVNKESISIITPSRNYMYETPFSGGSELITLIKFNIDATHIIEMFDKLIKDRDRNY